MKNIFVIVFCLFSVVVFSQPKNAVTEKIDGKEYYIHTVEKGETVYGISKQYKVKQDVIFANNPGAEKGLALGQKLKIPVPSSAATTVVVKENKPVKTDTIVKNESIQTDPVVTKDTTLKPGDKKHIVQKGETLYGISKKYGVADTKIAEWNPEVKNGLKEGMVLIIRNDKTNTGVKNNIETNPIDRTGKGEIVLAEHVIQKNETVFSICSKYKVSADSLKLYNNGLTEGLKKGNTLIVPVTKTFAEANKLSWYPDKNTMTEQKEIIQKANSKDVYEVGLFMPFYLDKNASFMENKGANSKAEIYEPTRQSLDFYHGVLLAVDSLSKAGLSVNLRVYDTYRDSARIAKLISSDEFAKLDLVIGPTEHVEAVAKVAKEKQIPVVCPFGYTNKILLDNPYVSKAVTSTTELITESSDFIVKKYLNENIILVDGKGKKDENAVKAYKKLLNEGLKAQGIKDTVKYVKSESYLSKTFSDHLRKDKVNVLVVPSNDYSYVSSFINNLNNLSIKWNYKDYKFVVFGTEEWLKYEDIDTYYKNRFNVHVPSPVYISYTDTLRTVPFIKAFRNKYASDPDKYAMMGFDIAYFYLAGYLQRGKIFATELDRYDIELVNTAFRYKRINETSGFLNTNVYILKYEDFRLIPQKR
ncbi:MAG: LysM peptidoglycan-binding domain-containing protein [Bacteroidota bacterium]